MDSEENVSWQHCSLTWRFHSVVLQIMLSLLTLHSSNDLAMEASASGCVVGGDLSRPQWNNFSLKVKAYY